MRFVLVALAVVGTLGLTAGESFAADGCSYDAYGRLYCAPGASPGVPYGGGGGYYQGGGYGGPRGYGPPRRGNLQYYCSLGDQTPISVRNDCVRYGFWR